LPTLGFFVNEPWDFVQFSVAALVWAYRHLDKTCRCNIIAHVIPASILAVIFFGLYMTGRIESD